MNSIFENENLPKQRHGCVTAWLVTMIVLNALIACVYFFATDFVLKSLPVQYSSSLIILLGVVGILNLICSVLLLKWKKIGFWGTILTSIIVLGINLKLGLGIGQSLFGLVGVAILYAVLKMKKNNVSAWDGLE